MAIAFNEIEFNIFYRAFLYVYATLRVIGTKLKIFYEIYPILPVSRSVKVPASVDIFKVTLSVNTAAGSS